MMWGVHRENETSSRFKWQTVQGSIASTQGIVCYAIDDDKTVFERFPILPYFGQKNGRSPDYFGSNFDLEPKSTNSNQPSSKTKNILEKLGME